MAKAELTSADRSEYRRLCKTVEEKLNSFVEVGQALQRIKDGKLYLTEFDTWDQFCEKRFSIHRNYANKMIAAAKVVNNVSANGYPGTHSNEEIPEENADTVSIESAPEKVIRPLTQLPEEKQPEAWEAAVEKAGGEQPTAAQVKEAVAEIKAESEPKTEEPKHLDALGNELPGSLWVTFAAVEKYKKAEKLISDAIKEVDEIVELPGGALFKGAGQHTLTRLRQARSDIKAYRPFTACPKCKGNPKCAFCGGTQYVIKQTYDTVQKAKA